MIRLNVNIDHIATIRQARKAPEPNPISAAVICELAGADGITVHLRGDRRHIQDQDVRLLRQIVTTHLNLEMAVTSEMVKIAREIKPDTVTLVPEDPNEITTQGGLDVAGRLFDVKKAINELTKDGIVVSTFIDPIEEQIDASKKAGARQIEICTARFAELTQRPGHFNQRNEDVFLELGRIAISSELAYQMEMQVAAGHGLTYRNVPMLLEAAELEELNIGHNIISRASLVGMDRAVREMIAAINTVGERPQSGSMMEALKDLHDDLIEDEDDGEDEEENGQPF